MEMSVTTVIARSPADVFAFVSDVSNDVHWRTGVTEAGFTTEPPLRVETDMVAASAEADPHEMRDELRRPTSEMARFAERLDPGISL